MKTLWPILIAPILTAILAVPLILERVPKNLWYGVRTARSLHGTDAEWYAINRAGGIALFVASLISLGLIGLFRLRGPIGPQAAGGLGLGFAALLLVSLGIALRAR